MTLAEVIRKHGRELRAVGVAIYTFIDVSPGCTYDEVVEALAVGRSTVIAYVNRLESMRLVSRTVRANDKGIPLPTLLNIANHTVHQTDSIKEGAREQGQVNTTVLLVETVSQVDSDIHGSSGTDAANNTVRPIDSGKRYRPATRGLNPPPHTPHRDNLNITSQPQPTASVGAGAPAEVGVGAVKLCRRLTKRNPNEQQRAKIAATVVDLDRWQAVLEQYMVEGQPTNHVDWMLERYIGDETHRRQPAVARQGGGRPPDAESGEGQRPARRDFWQQSKRA